MQRWLESQNQRRSPGNGIRIASGAMRRSWHRESKALISPTMAAMTATHLVIASVVPPLREHAPLPPLPALPQLEALLVQLRETGQLTCDADAPDTPFERVLAQLHGLSQSPGQVPWAALETRTTG